MAIKTFDKTVLMGRDFEALGILLPLHAPGATRLLDCTYNQGVMWRGTGLVPLRADRDPTQPVDVVADFCALPFATGAFDVVVFDPPHLPVDADSPGASKIMVSRYGLGGCDPLRTGSNVEGLFAPFLVEAKRVLRPDGVVLAKICDLIHNHRYQWQQVAFVQAVREAGMTPCDMLIKADPAAGKMISGKWQTPKHLRKAHSYWIVARNSKRCERAK